MKKRTWFKRSSLIISTAVSLMAPSAKVGLLSETKSSKPCKKAKAPLSNVADDGDADAAPPFGDRPPAMGPPLPEDEPFTAVVMEDVGATTSDLTSVDSCCSSSEAPKNEAGKPLRARPPVDKRRYAWKKEIGTTVFWIGELPTEANPTPNHASSWDENWTRNYGGYDNPDARDGFLPADFTPKQNPFYVALPYNDVGKNGHKEEASKIIPWFKQEQGASEYKSTCKGRWIAIRKGNRVCYAQWEDAGPITTTDGNYVFGHARPKSEDNNGAGLDVSPAVRDFLGLDGQDKTDWKFVEFEDVPLGPWAELGSNNDFVMNRRHADGRSVAQSQSRGASRKRAAGGA